MSLNDKELEGLAKKLWMASGWRVETFTQEQLDSLWISMLRSPDHEQWFDAARFLSDSGVLDEIRTVVGGTNELQQREVGAHNAARAKLIGGADKCEDCGIELHYGECPRCINLEANNDQT